MKDFLGVLVLVLAVLMAVVAFPSQIAKNHRDGRCGLSMPMIVLAMSVYLSRAAYAFTIGSWYIFVPDSLGALFSAVIALQYFRMDIAMRLVETIKVSKRE